MVGMALAESIYAEPAWTRLVAAVTEHPSLRAVAGPSRGGRSQRRPATRAAAAARRSRCADHALLRNPTGLRMRPHVSRRPSHGFGSTAWLRDVRFAPSNQLSRGGLPRVCPEHTFVRRVPRATCD